MSTAHLVVTLEVPVAWGEQDLFGHVNNIVYFRYFESVRMHWLERVGILRMHKDEGVGVILASTTCDFKKPVVWPQKLTVSTGATDVKNTSFIMEYRITDGTGDLVATGTSVQVMFDYGRGEKTPIPESIRNAINALQQQRS